MQINYFKEPTHVNVKWNGIEIMDSYKVPHRHYANILNRIQAETENNQLWYVRSRWSLECEWAVHNFCYALGIRRDMTKSVFLCPRMTWYEKLCYHTLGTLLYIWK